MPSQEVSSLRGSLHYWHAVEACSHFPRPCRGSRPWVAHKVCRHDWPKADHASRTLRLSSTGAMQQRVPAWQRAPAWQSDVPWVTTRGLKPAVVRRDDLVGRVTNHDATSRLQTCSIMQIGASLLGQTGRPRRWPGSRRTLRSPTHRKMPEAHSPTGCGNDCTTPPAAELTAAAQILDREKIDGLLATDQVRPRHTGGTRSPPSAPNSYCRRPRPHEGQTTRINALPRLLLTSPEGLRPRMTRHPGLRPARRPDRRPPLRQRTRSLDLGRTVACCTHGPWPWSGPDVYREWYEGAAARRARRRTGRHRRRGNCRLAGLPIRVGRLSEEG